MSTPPDGPPVPGRHPPSDPPDHHVLAQLASGGDGAHWAWELLVSRYSGRMYAVARSFGVNPQTAEDLVQTAWLRFLERRHQLRDEGAVGAWLCTVVRHEALRVVTRRREIPTEVARDTVDPGEGQLDALVRRERAGAVRLAFDALGEECRRLLRLCVADPPLSYDEIAAALGRPRGSLGPTRRRCLDRLCDLLPTEFGGTGRGGQVSTRPSAGSDSRRTRE